MRECGAQASSFPIIVAFGERASLPHAVPTGRKLSKGEPLLIDWGASCDFYTSDLTRVFFLGDIREPFREIYQIVLEAQKAAISLVKPGISLCVIDAGARDYIKAKGYGEQFGHSTGHGLGREVHEVPRVSSRNLEKAVAGLVFTIEPGIYLPGKAYYELFVSICCIFTGNGGFAVCHRQ